jgi:HD-GYP domain-containing protein (c-di-GMP phosphodiesterase class II)
VIALNSSLRSSSRFTQHDYARALRVILHKEMGIPFTLYDGATGRRIDIKDSAAGLSTGDTWKLLPAAPLMPETVQSLANHGEAQVVAETPGSYRLMLVVFQAGKPAFVAAGQWEGLARNKLEAEREAGWLRQWLHSLGERLRLTDQLTNQRSSADDQHAQAKSAWEGLLSLDHVMRRLRLHKDAGKNLQRILEGVRLTLPAGCLACVPPLPDSEPILFGDDLITPDDATELAMVLSKHPACKDDAPIFINQVKELSWSVRFPRVETLLAFPILDTAPTGWLIAINKGQHGEAVTPFRRSDAALVLPFVALARLQVGAAQRFMEFKELVVGLARSLTTALDAKDSYTFGHSERTARIGVELGRTLGLGSDELNDIYLAGLLHDVGKIGVPDAVLAKKEPLEAEDFDYIRQHVTIGYTILSDLRAIRSLLPGVLYHHERWDGRGYPEGLAGDKIPHLARILAVADAYDAMSTARPYRSALPLAEVERRLQEGSGSQWDPEIIEAFVRCRQKIHAIRQRGVGESLRAALDGALRSQGSTFTT